MVSIQRVAGTVVARPTGWSVRRVVVALLAGWALTACNVPVKSDALTTYGATVGSSCTTTADCTGGNQVCTAGSCVCADGFFGNSGNSSCTPCDGSCVTCSGPTADDCTSCNPNSVLAVDIGAACGTDADCRYLFVDNAASGVCTTGACALSTCADGY